MARVCPLTLSDGFPSPLDPVCGAWGFTAATCCALDFPYLLLLELTEKTNPTQIPRRYHFRTPRLYCYGWLNPHMWCQRRLTGLCSFFSFSLFFLNVWIKIEKMKRSLVFSDKVWGRDSDIEESLKQQVKRNLRSISN